METVTNLASAASRAIWGDSTTNDEKENETKGQEPLSGETGNVEAGEPYDKGNAEPTSTPAEPKIVDPTPPRTEEPELATLTSNLKITDTTAAKEDVRNDAEPVIAPSAPLETKALQVAEVPSSKEPEGIKETKTEPEGAVAVESSGAGSTTLVKDSGVTTAEKEDGLLKDSTGEDAGDQYVKSSGIKADSGDFGATNSGAGKESDRLLEQNGVHHELAAAASPVDTEDVGGKDEKAGKTRIRDKIKEKLHIGHKDRD